jgi:hypothetical protein
MDHQLLEPEQKQEDPDRAAILMMLSYVETECRRLGEHEAARHAAVAATLVQVTKSPECSAPASSARCAPLH